MQNQGWIVDQPGGAFRLADLPHVPLRSGQVRVRICASGVNPLDLKIRKGDAQHALQPLPAVLGIDMAGVVEERSPDGAPFEPGDEVYGMAGGVGGRQGTLARSIVAEADLLAPKPKNLTMREAAALPLSVVTAWEGLVDRARVCEQQKVLIHAGAGGVGQIAVQLARAFGAEVFATVSENKAEVVMRLGATPIDYRRLSVEDYVAQSTGGSGFDIVYDTVGGETLDASFRAVKRYTGHVVSSLGWGSHSLAPLSFRGATYSGVFTLLPLLTGEGMAHHGEILRQAAALAEAGQLRPVLNERRFSGATLEDAYAAVASGLTGKVVIEL